MATLPQFQSDDRVMQMMQNQWGTQLNPVLSNPVVGGILLPNNALIASQDNFISHKLATNLQGWIVTRIKATDSAQPYSSVTNWSKNSGFTPTNFGTIANQNIFSRQIGDTLFVSGYWQAGTAAASTAKIALPSGTVIDSSKFGSKASIEVVGQWNQIKAAAGASSIYPSGFSGILFYDGSDTANIYFATATENSVYDKANGSGVIDTSGYNFVNFSIPVVGLTANSNDNFVWEAALPSEKPASQFLNLHCRNNVTIDLYVF